MENIMNPGATLTLMSPVELQEGVASLSKGAYFKEASLDMTLSILTESAAQMSGVERVGIWALTDGRQELRCLDMYALSLRKHSRGECFRASQYPNYFRALTNEGSIAADDAYFHPSTAEFAVDYLPKNKITAMLDTPIHIRGELQGVLCLEQVGSRQPWTTSHRLFANAVANLVTLALVEYEAGEARKEALAANERLQAVFEASRDALLLADGESGLILDANRQAERLFGCTRRDLVGKHQWQLHPKAVEGSVSKEFRQMISGQLQTAVVTEIQRCDGSVRSVEITSEVADLSDGRRLALGVFRPI
ncbi:MAG: PAS domain S-box protein [Azonexus sp.]|nr:PAS domain S-box protein [Azonexus sp.]